MLKPNDLTYVPLFNGNYGKRRKKGHDCKYNLKGVYFIKENEKLVYVGMSNSCVVKALYRHFWAWSDSRPSGEITRVTYSDFLLYRNYTVAIWNSSSSKAVTQMEMRMIKKYIPRDNKQYLEKVEYKEQRLMDYDDDQWVDTEPPF